MKKPDLKGLSAEQVKYIEYLESCLNGSSELIQQLNYTSKIFALDLEKICNGDDETEITNDDDSKTTVSTLIFLSGDSRDKKFERVMTLFDKIDKIKALSSFFKAEEKEKMTGNAFEDTSKKIQAKLNGVAK